MTISQSAPALRRGLESVPRLSPSVTANGQPERPAVRLRASTALDAGAPPHREKRSVAAYLWCGSSDTSLIEECRAELGRFAARLGLPGPAFFEDGGLPARATPPALACLLELVAVGVFQAVLIPDRFVLASGDRHGTTPGTEFAAVIGAVADDVDCRIIELSPAE